MVKCSVCVCVNLVRRNVVDFGFIPYFFGGHIISFCFPISHCVGFCFD